MAHVGDVRTNTSIVRFSIFEVDLRAGELRKQGVKIRLQEQPFQVLQVLLERPGELVTRDELQRRIWPDTFVDADHGLYNAVKKLREALGDVSDTPQFVETLPKRGYRFIGALNGKASQAELVSGTTMTAKPRFFGLWSWAIAMGGVTVLALGSLAAFKVTKNRQDTSPSSAHQPTKSRAHEDLLQGRYHVDQAYEAIVFKSGGMKKSEDEFANGLSLLETSIQEDPDCVQAYLELAKAIMAEPPHVGLAPKARAALIKALSLDDSNAETHLVMATFLYWNTEGGWDNAVEHYKRAIQLRPDFTEGHEAYAEYLDDMGEFDAGMQEHQKAQLLDPNTDYLSASPLTPRNVRLERRRKFLRVNLFSGQDYWNCGELEFEAGHYSDALRDWTAVARYYGWNEEATAFERAYASGGSQALIAEVAGVADAIAKGRYFPRDMLIDAHRYAGDRNGTLAWLETSYKEHINVVHHLRSDLRWDPYRSDPRFQAVARQVGLP